MAEQLQDEPGSGIIQCLDELDIANAPPTQPETAPQLAPPHQSPSTHQAQENQSQKPEIAPAQPVPSPDPPSKPHRKYPFPPHYSFPPVFTLQPVQSTRSYQLLFWSSLIQSYCRFHRIFKLILPEVVPQLDLFVNSSLNRKLSIPDATAIIDWMTTTDGGNRAEWVVDGGKPTAAVAASISVVFPTASRGKQSAPGQTSKSVCWIHWRRPEEWGALVEEWVKLTGRRGAILTLYELANPDAAAIAAGATDSFFESDDYEGSFNLDTSTTAPKLPSTPEEIRRELRNIDGPILLRALQYLAKQGRAKVFAGTGGAGAIKDEDWDSLGVKIL